MKPLFLTFILAFFATNLLAQSKSCQSFETLMQRGNANYNATPKRYQEAINAYLAAILDCSEKASQAQAKITTIFKEIEGLKNEAEKAKAAVQAKLDEIRRKDQLQLSTYADNVGKALTRYDIGEARREMEKIRGTQIAPKDLLARLEKQIADTLQSLNPEMVRVEGGTFLMGCDTLVDGCEKDETQHQVTLSTYQIGKYEVTQALWQKVMGGNPAYFQPSNGKEACPQCPVEQVNWNDIQGFIEKLNEKTGKKYRLPTEAEWEYAARGGNKSPSQQGRRQWGGVYAGTTENPDDYAWYDSNSDSKTHPVGTRKPNELGIYDMSGNVWEWCEDWYAADFYEKSAGAKNPVNKITGSDRVYRGGSWDSSAVGLRVAFRNDYAPTDSLYSLGFRLVCL